MYMPEAAAAGLARRPKKIDGARAQREGVDTALIDKRPIRNAEFLPDVFAQFLIGLDWFPHASLS